MKKPTTQTVMVWFAWLCITAAVALAVACPVPAYAADVETVDYVSEPASQDYCDQIGAASVTVTYYGVTDPHDPGNRIEVVARDEFGMVIGDKGMELSNVSGTWHRRIGLNFTPLAEVDLGDWLFEVNWALATTPPSCSEWPGGCNSPADDICWTQGGAPPITAWHIEFNRMLVGTERVTCQIRCAGETVNHYRSCRIDRNDLPPWLPPDPNDPQPPTGTCPCAGLPVCDCYPSGP